jgi:hypothetical protein
LTRIASQFSNHFLRDFYAKFENEAYNPLGWRIRLHREVASLRKAAESNSLGKVLSLGCGDGQFELLLAP